MKYLWVFILLNIANIVRGTDLKSGTEEYYDPSQDEDQLLLWHGLFTKLNTLLLETNKINQNLLDLNKRFDDLSKRQDTQEDKITKLLELTKEKAENFTSNCQAQLSTISSNIQNASRLKQSTSSTETNKTLNVSVTNPTWITILRRQDGSVDFYRNWTDYKTGFGNPPNGEFFIGLDRLHELTTQGKPQQLMVVLRDWNNETRTANYSHFQIDEESKKYRITTLGTYSGNAGDSLKFHLNTDFATPDADNTSTKCTKSWSGAWWFSNCYHSHLFGPYRKEDLALTKGVGWMGWKGHDYSLKFAEMKIRPAQ